MGLSDDHTRARRRSMDESSRAVVGGGAMRIVSGVTGPMLSVATRYPPEPPVTDPKARARQQMLQWHRAHGGNISRTARHFGYSRQTVYRWLRREDRRRPTSLANRSSRPQRVRARMPFPVHAVQVDGGREFMAAF